MGAVLCEIAFKKTITGSVCHLVIRMTILCPRATVVLPCPLFGIVFDISFKLNTVFVFSILFHCNYLNGKFYYYI